jgi:DNA helicase HerA-like ATPase
MSLGTVISATTRTAKIKIFDTGIRQGAYLELKHPHGPVLAQIIHLSRTADSEIAEATLLGHSDGKGGSFRVETPPDIDAEISYASITLIRDVLGVQSRSKTGLYMGLLYKHNLKVWIDYRPLLTQHVAVIAKTGGGKSYTVGVMCEEIIKRGMPIIVIDPHGEYIQTVYQNDNSKDIARMKRFGILPRGYVDYIREFAPDTTVNPSATPLRFDERNLDVDDIISLTTIGDSEAQKNILERAMYMVKRMYREPSIERLCEYVARERSPAKYRLIREVQRIRTLEIFQDIPTKLRHIVGAGMTIINLKGASEEVQHFCVAKIAKRVFEEAKVGKVPPCFFVIEEAHNFIPESSKTIASKPLYAIASEGRKFGVGLCVVSQRTARVSKSVLAQCGTHFIHKLTNSEDIQAVVESLEGFTTSMAEDIQRLPIGVALVSTIGLPHPVTIEIRPRESKHGGGQKIT